MARLACRMPRLCRTNRASVRRRGLPVDSAGHRPLSQAAVVGAGLKEQHRLVPAFGQEARNCGPRRSAAYHDSVRILREMPKDLLLFIANG